ncbi:spore coat U domain-containing protein [Lysobacter sp. A6]|uniref:Spore coat U domain-containing protein n=1 Tax=Noviluteimonas lactosilytica TaxID=2888523 RepID=A0ABS8JDI7_9GAMM|nr:spore coat U domain-containing protein [Lysobacter lactosilyticus]MCC8361670.1 spore coat U domain-containing protein [Lysobacter lactosilyticus]
MTPRATPLLFALLVLAALFGFAPRAHAASCSVAATAMAFGTYDPISATPRDSSADVSVDCNGNGNQTSVGITFDAGTYGSFATSRAMGQGANRLYYNLYVDASRTTVFGSGVSVSCTTGVDSPGCTGSNPSGGALRATRTIFGRMPTGQDVASGPYSDVVRITITF